MSCMSRSKHRVGSSPTLWNGARKIPNFIFDSSFAAGANATPVDVRTYDGRGWRDKQRARRSCNRPRMQRRDLWSGDVGRETAARGGRLRVDSDLQVEFVAVSVQHREVQRPIQQRAL